jgi:molybdate-binding protein
MKNWNAHMFEEVWNCTATLRKGLAASYKVKHIPILLQLYPKLLAKVNKGIYSQKDLSKNVQSSPELETAQGSINRASGTLQ